MKLVSYGFAGAERPGVFLEASGKILALDRAAPGRWPTLLSLIREGDAALSALQTLVQSPDAAWLDDAHGLRLGPPVTNPSKIICVGLNYRGHAEEQNKPIPTHPLLFSKATSCLIGHGDPIWYPIEEDKVDYEVELAVIFGKPAFRIDPARWQEYVFGYTILHDVSARDTQKKDGTWVRGKSFDTFCPLGPWIVTQDELPDPQALSITCHLNGSLRQQGHTSDLIFSIPQLLAFCTQNTTYLPGDILATGTPSGVGIHRKPPACMSVGDIVSLTIEGIGTLTNPVEDRPLGASIAYPWP